VPGRVSRTSVCPLPPVSGAGPLLLPPPRGTAAATEGKGKVLFKAEQEE